MKVHEPHRLVCGSVDGLPIHQMLNGTHADILYADPPWDDAHMASFATMARKQTGVAVQPIRWETFITGMCSVLAGHVKGWVFVEMGRQHAERTASYLRLVCEDVTIHPTTYRSGGQERPTTLISGHRRPGHAATWRVPADGGTGGLRQVLAVLSSGAKPGDVVLDPCCGTGLTAKACLRLGLTFYGNELNAMRARKTASLLESGATVRIS